MTGILLQLTALLLFDAMFVVVLSMVTIPLGVVRPAAFAVLRRNFLAYFANPTGYVFLCLFVLLTSVAAFWPYEFFAANLATLDQLNRYLPLIMLVFIPAITMSVWADERRQGTDELLLTLPARDWEIVIGKYLAATAIFTASLLFSQLSSFVVLASLTYGDVDIGLFVVTYFGYWMVGLAMLAVAMVASFLTNNLTVAFIVGALLNAPLAAAHYAGAIIPSAAAAQDVSRWSYANQFADFGRGVVSLSSTSFFLSLAGVGVYLSIVLVGRRHWVGSREGTAVAGHYLVRLASLIIIVATLNIVTSRFDFVRYDFTDGKVSSLADATKRLLADIRAGADLGDDSAGGDEGERESADPPPIRIEAFASPNPPEPLVQTRLDLISKLKEIAARGGPRIQVRIHDAVDPLDETARRAERQYGITPQPVMARSRGVLQQQQVILGVAYTSGLEQRVTEYLPPGATVEYELMQSIGAIADKKRKTLGIVLTDTRLFGGRTFTVFPPENVPPALIVDEFRKQYDIERIDLSEPIPPEKKLDVLLVTQPSSLPPEQLENLLSAILAGTPTAIFEDPRPAFFPWAPGVDQSRRPLLHPRTGQPLMKQAKGDISRLWELLGIVPVSRKVGPRRESLIIWQRYNPYRQLQDAPDVSVIIDNAAPMDPRAAAAQPALNPNSLITADLQQLLFPAPGAIERAPRAPADIELTELVLTGDQTGTLRLEDMALTENVQALRMRQRPTELRYLLAARIRRREGAATSNGETEKRDAEKSNEGANAAKGKSLNVVYVADVDVLASQFVQIRDNPGEEIAWRFNNVSFVLNILDVLADDTRYIKIRSRQPRHSTLQLVEEAAAAALNRVKTKIGRAQERSRQAEREAEDEKQDAVRRYREAYEILQEKVEAGEADPALLLSARQQWQMQEQVAEQRKRDKLTQIRAELQREVGAIQRNLDMQVRQVQNNCKFWAVALPPIPPLIVALVVFVRRRLREREGVASTRLR